jgi:hypothetical protein
VSVETQAREELENMICAMTATWGWSRGLLSKEEAEKLLAQFQIKNEDGELASVRDFAGTMNQLAVPLKKYARSL